MTTRSMMTRMPRCSAAMGEFDEVAERAVARIDAVIVRDIVTVVLAGRRLERHQPDRGDAEPVQIIEPPQQALEIADAVAIGIHIGADGKAIDHAVLVPEVVDHTPATSLQPSSIRLEHPIALVFDRNVSHMLTAGEGPGFLHGNTFKIMSGNKFLDIEPLQHRCGSKPKKCGIVPGRELELLRPLAKLISCRLSSSS